MKFLFSTVLFVLLFLTYNSCEVNKKKQDNNKIISTQDSELIINNSESEDKFKINSLKVYISENNVRLRSEPNLTSETIDLLQKNIEVKIIEISKEKQVIDDMNFRWYKIDVPAINKVGWVYGEFVIDDYGLQISNAKLLNSRDLVSIENRVMGYEEEFPTNRKLIEPELIDLIAGFAIGLPVTEQDIFKYYVESGNEKVFKLDKPKRVVVSASYKEYKYNVEYDLTLAEFDSENIPNSFYIPIIPFENKYWINPTGVWIIEISDESGIIFTTTYEKHNNSLFYLTESNSPFDIINIEMDNIKRNIQYTYRYFAKDNTMVLLCLSSDRDQFYPIYMMKSNENSKDKKIYISWSEQASTGTYAFFEFSNNEIPTVKVSIPVWGQLFLE